LTAAPTDTLPGNLLTIYGRKPVLEALENPTIEIYRVHLANSNRPNPLIRQIETRCKQRDIDVAHHDRDRLARISKNKKQDQGVAADIICPYFGEFNEFLTNPPANFSLLAVENVTNPQNLGMIIRSVCASPMTGLLLPRKGCARLDSLVIKASAGTLFKATVLFCDDLRGALQQCRRRHTKIYGLSSHNSEALADFSETRPNVFLLGNETTGLSAELLDLCDARVRIPMENDVESLNVAVAAGILAFRQRIGAYTSS